MSRLVVREGVIMSIPARLVSHRVVRSCLALALVLAAVVTVRTIPGSAQVNLSVTPSLLDVVADADASTTQDIVLQNGGTEPVSLAIEVFAQDGIQPPADATGWVTVDQPAIDIPAGSSATLGVGLTIPEDAVSGGYYANIRITTVGSADQAGTVVAGEVVVPVLFTISGKGEIDRTTSVDRFAAFLEDDGRIGFRARITNAGNVHYRSPGTIEITGSDGTTMTTMDLQESTFVLPGQSRDLQAFGTLPLAADDTYGASISIDIGADAPIQAETSFSLKDLETAQLDVAICENLDGGPTVTLDLTNPGQIGVLPDVRLSIRDAVQSQIVDTALPQGTLLWPQADQQIEAQLPERLVTGSYTLVGTLQVGSGPAIETQLAFDIGGTGPQVAPLCG